MVHPPNLSRAESVTQLLGDDHRHLDDVLADAKRALATADLPHAAARFAEFRAGIEHHIVAEEHVLFPLLESLTGASSSGPTHEMRVEHAEIRTLLAEVTVGLLNGAAAVLAALATPLALLTALLLAHNDKEARIVYPASDRAARAAGALDGLLVRLQTI